MIYLPHRGYYPEKILFGKAVIGILDIFNRFFILRQCSLDPLFCD
jgi:hypothetical protein